MWSEVPVSLEMAWCRLVSENSCRNRKKKSHELVDLNVSKVV
jgi:hypothetical protein